MPLITRDLQQSTWLNPTSCWNICNYQRHIRPIFCKMQFKVVVGISPNKNGEFTMTYDLTFTFNIYVKLLAIVKSLLLI